MLKELIKINLIILAIIVMNAISTSKLTLPKREETYKPVRKKTKVAEDKSINNLLLRRYSPFVSQK